MADDRMLSDEILLGLIKANSGGGGGTSNYNDLSNQPQINGTTLTGNKTASDLGLVAAETGKGLSENDFTDEDKAIVGGVTAALADKADKSAVKNEFIGTLEQWNALTAEQKKAYDTYQITNDYTEGSGGGNLYATETVTCDSDGDALLSIDADTYAIISIWANGYIVESWMHGTNKWYARAFNLNGTKYSGSITLKYVYTAIQNA